MMGRLIGSTVAASFGLAFVLANSATLPGGIALGVRIAAILAYVALLVAGFANSRRIFAGAHQENRRPFAGKFWIIVAGEVAALFGGLFLIDRVFGLGHAGVAWVAIVVGAHFVPMALITGERFYMVLAALMVPLGVVGLVLAVVGAPQLAVDAVAGLGSGITLLGAAWWGILKMIGTAPAPVEA